LRLDAARRRNGFQDDEAAMNTAARPVQVVLSAILLTLVVFLTTQVTERNGGYDSDGLIYGRMALSPPFECSAAPAPFCQRVLTPLIVSLLPGDPLNRFRWVAFVSSVLSLCTFYGILRQVGHSIAMSHLGVLFYAGVFWTLKFSFYSPAYIDHVSQLLLLLTIYTTISGHTALAVGLLCLSAFQKESLPLFSLFVAADWWHQRHRRSIVRPLLAVMAIIGLPVACSLLARHLAPVDGQAAISVLLGEAKRFLRPVFWSIFIQAIFSGLGLLPVLLLVQYRPTLEFLRQRPAFIVYLLLAAAALLGGCDKSRLFNYSLPVVVVLALETVRSLRAANQAVVWVACFLCAHWYLGNYLTPLGAFSDYRAKLVPEHANWRGDGSRMPFLIRDCIVGLILFAGTIQVMIGEWCFRPSIGFTRRRAGLCAAPRG
jgi:hypothetical protein